MKIRRADRFTKCFAQAVKEIENQCFLDLDGFLRAFQLPNAAPLAHFDIDQTAQARDQQPEEKEWPHEQLARLFPRCRLMEVLF